MTDPTTAEPTFTEIGRRMPRREDRRFLTGQGRYLGDIEFPRALHVRFVRSPHPHGRIVAIDADAARAMTGVVAVATGTDFAQWALPLRMTPPIEGLQPTVMEPFPTSIVRFDGDLVACVVAETATHAEDAAERVVVDYETLPAVASSAQALKPGAATVDAAVPGNVVSYQRGKAGHPERQFAQAYRVVEARFRQGRQTHTPLEHATRRTRWTLEQNGISRPASLRWISRHRRLTLRIPLILISHARAKCEAWRRDYNEFRPHSAIGNKPPITLLNRSGEHGSV